MLAKNLIGLLRSAFNFPAHEIRCTSVNGYRLPIGVKPNERLRQEIFECEILIGLLTPSSLSSHYVLFEMGARWGKDLVIFPLFCSEGLSELLSGPLSEINALDACDIQQVYQFITDISHKLSLPCESTEVYSEQAELFVKQAKTISSVTEQNVENSLPIIQSLNKTKINLQGKDYTLSEIFLNASPDFGIGAFRDNICRSLVKLLAGNDAKKLYTSSEENTDIVGELMILDLINERNIPGIRVPKYYLTELGKRVLAEIKTNA